jgi:hypothetical protein
MFRIMGDPDDRPREDDENGDEEAAPDHYPHGIAARRDYRITHAHNLRGEFCRVPVSRPPQR